MSLDFRQQRQLDRIESRLLRSDPHLAAMLTIFARLAMGEHMPAGERVAARLDRAQQTAALIAKALAEVVTSIGLLVGMVTAMVMGFRARTPQPARQQTGR
jgi:Protein of unknown function (DUF3040)